MSPPDDNFARALTSETLRSVHAAWKNLAAGRIGPRRSELKPGHLRRATPFTFTLDVLEGGKDFRLGFAGDRVVQFFTPSPSAPADSNLVFFEEAKALIRCCIGARKPLASGPKPTRYAGKEHLEREVLLLPLSDDGVTVTGLLGALETWRLGTHPHSTVPVLAD